MTHDRRAAERAGRWAETGTAWLLRLKGFRILARHRQGRRGSGGGEIDLIARRGRLLVFIEVKRRGAGLADADPITPRQKERLRRGAAAFLQQRPDLSTCEMRFDAVVWTGLWPLHITDAWR